MSKKERIENTKKMLWLIIISSIAIIVILLIIVIFIEPDEKGKGPSINITELNGSGKIENPEKYSWEDFDELDSEQKGNFIDSFDSAEDFDKWLEKTGEKEVVLYPWDIEGRTPSEYTWEEYEKLNETEKSAFKETFLTEEEFKIWENSVLGSGDRPWEKAGKNPSEYTWEEFDNLTMAQQQDFLSSFETPEALEEWLNNASEK